jgi:hypothetical protein
MLQQDYSRWETLLLDVFQDVRGLLPLPRLIIGRLVSLVLIVGGGS